MKAQDKRQKRRTAADRQAKAQARLLGGKSPAIQPGMQGGNTNRSRTTISKKFMKRLLLF